uniref:RGS domain-containing protein n=1 Tax=Macrostomum lignano TaxID=282301 RepID=A0A1I8F2U3_9PLAT
KLSTSAASAGPKSLLNDRIWFRFQRRLQPTPFVGQFECERFHNLLDAYQKSGSASPPGLAAAAAPCRRPGAMRRSEVVEAAQLNDARVQCQLARQFRSLQDSDLDQGQQRRRHAVEELLALRSTSAAVSSGASSVDPVEFCNRSLGFRLHLGTAVGTAAAAETSCPVRVTSVDLDGPADNFCASSSTEESLVDLSTLWSPTCCPHSACATPAGAKGAFGRPPLPPLDTLPRQSTQLPRLPIDSVLGRQSAPAVSDMRGLKVRQICCSGHAQPETLAGCDHRREIRGRQWSWD